MQRFKNILLVHPCDEATLSRAISLARNNRAKLKVIRVERELTGTRLITSPGSPALELQELVVKEYKSQMKEFIAPVKKTGVRISSKVAVGTPFLEIVREVIVEQHDLVMMTAEGKGGLKERFFGNTSLHLIRKCPCPVTYSGLAKKSVHSWRMCHSPDCHTARRLDRVWLVYETSCCCSSLSTWERI